MAFLDLRGLRGRMSGCGDIPASWAKEDKPETSTFGDNYDLRRTIFSVKIPRLCKAGLGEVESFNYFSLRSSALQFLEGLPGFVPADDPLLFRQKWAKPCWPWCSPSGSLRGSPTPAARKLAMLKQCAPFSRCRLHCSATPQGQKSLQREWAP